MTRPLVESVPIVLTPRCLRLPALSDSSRLSCWQTGSVRFTVWVAPDGVPVSLRLPKQIVSARPLRVLPAQRIPLASDFIAHPTGPRRRFWLRCPRRECRRACSRLYLPDGETRFACRECWGLVYRSRDATHWRTYLAAADPRSRSALALLPTLPLLLRWHTEGKGRKRYWRGAEPATRPGTVYSPSNRGGRPRALSAEDIEVLKGKVLWGIPRQRIAREFGVSPQTIDRYVTESLPLLGDATEFKKGCAE